MRDLETVQGRLQFVLVPSWLEETIRGTNLRGSTMVTDIKKLSDTLSKHDVKKYLTINTDTPVVLNAMGLSDTTLDSVLRNNTLFRNERGEFYWYDEKDEKGHSLVQFDYFNDSEKVNSDLSRYYYEINPIHDDIMGVYIRMADVDDDVKELQIEALRAWIIVMGRYVSFAEIAKSGFLGEYLSKIQ